MKSATFLAKINDNTVDFILYEKQGLLRKNTSIPVQSWSDFLPENKTPILAVIDDLIETYSGIRQEDKISLPHDAIIGLTETQAGILGLPPAIPFAFDIRANGMIDQDSFMLSTSWVTSGGIREFITRKGAFAVKGEKTYRIPSPVYEIVKAAEIISNTHANDNPTRMKALAALHDILPLDESGNRIKVDTFLGSIRVLHASSFSLQIPTDGESFQFNPVLFSRKAVDRQQDDNRMLDEAESLLTPNLQHIFAEKRFKRFDEVRDCYAVDKGFYIYVDQDLKKALSVVRKFQKASPAERRAFIRSPQRIISEQLGEQINSDAIERLFVETEQYADNVLGLGRWQAPVIPWLIKQPNTWLPEKFGIKIGDTYVQIKPDDVIHIRNEINTRLSNGFSDGEQQPYMYDSGNGVVEIPVTQQTKQALDDIIGVIRIENPEQKQDEHLQEDVQTDPSTIEIPSFLIVADNIHETNFVLEPRIRATHKDYKLPVVLKSTLKSHQKEGLKWLVDAWSEGFPGVLLADDMGLGKTLQALTFLAWIKERKLEGHEKCKEPVLIIAPTGLLNNWQNEVLTHLYEPYLGEKGIIRAYGKNLSEIRSGKNNDLDTGQVNLNRDSLRNYDVVLTTYETYRDYHHSFAGIKFSAAVLDECQKIKNPKSQINRALASMNAEFIITMTGTPIENAIEDLWTILDRTWSGFLGDLKSFSSTYTADNHEELRNLTVRLKEPAIPHATAPILWRRMKEDILDDLPKKTPHWEHIDMPPEQANAYRQVILRAKDQEPPPILHTLHALRGISLHPIDPSKVLSDINLTSYDDYIKSSARLIKTIEILDRIFKNKEKTLVFIETIDMQSLMAEILRKRYGLKKRPSIINGKTGVDKIQKHVDEFQNDKNSDVMILSPKVGGVGLTLTAANNVIHLSRWWNPAVEDQSTDRIYRIGQTKDVNVYYPMAIHPDTAFREHSFDLKLNALLERKRKLSRDMLIPVEDARDAENLFNETVGFSSTISDTKPDDLDRMEPVEFEEWALRYARQNGYNADRTQRSWDKGADGIITHKKTGKRFILQCKHSGREKILEEKVIEDLLRAREAYDNEAGLVALTNTHFSKALKRKMEQFGIRYFDREHICTYCSRL